MLLNVLAVGDVVGEGGQDILARRLREVKREEDIHFTVVNGENASGVGLTPRQARGMYDAGADVITLGNHTWNRIQIADFLDKDPYILRPANYAGRVPGRGFGMFDGPRGLRIGVMNLMGRLELNSNLDSPFKAANQLLRGTEAQRCDLVLVDFHAEATSEKGALAWYLDGRVQALWGTHTHVPTADGQILPKGTGFLTDLGMTGPRRSVSRPKLKETHCPFLRFNATGICATLLSLSLIQTSTPAALPSIQSPDGASRSGGWTWRSKSGGKGAFFP